MTPTEFDAALAELGWKGTDFCHRAGLVPNTVWRWRKGLVAVPGWVPEYLGTLLELQRLHARFVAVHRPARLPPSEGGGDDESGSQADPLATEPAEPASAAG